MGQQETAIGAMKLTVADLAAGFIFIGATVASIVAERACGPDSENCGLTWSFKASRGPHCATVHADGGGLGDPALTVGSLQFTAALPYLVEEVAKMEGGTGNPSVLPVVAIYLGIASFLFHAHSTDLHHRLDMTGVTLLGPAVYDAVVSTPRGDTTPPWFPRWISKFYSAAAGLIARVVAFSIPLALICALYPRGALMYALNGSYGGLGLVGVFVWGVSVKTGYQRVSGLALGVVSLLLGVVLISAGNGPSYWSCVPTQLGEPHYWGHFFAALGTTLLSRRWNSQPEKTYVSLPSGRSSVYF